jgi:hypothetical protein
MVTGCGSITKGVTQVILEREEDWLSVQRPLLPIVIE